MLTQGLGFMLKPGFRVSSDVFVLRVYDKWSEPNHA